jgi:hypothetical protein
MEVRLPRYLIDMKLFFLADSPLPHKKIFLFLEICTDIFVGKSN